MINNLIINPCKPVDFNEKAVALVIERSGSLIADIKHDGVRCELVIKPTADINGRPAGRAYAFSRSDKLLPSLRELFTDEKDQLLLGQLLRESLYPTGIVIDGEVMVKGMTFQKSSGRIRSKQPIPVEQLEFVVYGYLPLQHFVDNDKRATFDTATCVMQEQIKVLVIQLRDILPQMSWSQCQSYDVFDLPSLYELYEHVREAGHEGLVLKDPLHPWHRGKKVGWWKMKPENTTDGRVVGVLWGTPGKKYEGKVIGFEVELEDNGVVVNVDGLTDADVEKYTKQYIEAQEGMAGNLKEDHPDYVRQPADGEANPFRHWAIQVKFMEWTEDGSLRHPKFDRWRGTESDPTVKS